MAGVMNGAVVFIGKFFLLYVFSLTLMIVVKLAQWFLTPIEFEGLLVLSLFIATSRFASVCICLILLLNHVGS